MRHSDPPPWHGLSEDLFEDLCCDVHGLGAEIKSTVRYGLRGQRQLGVDIVADRVDGKREAAQCKCYRDFTKGVLDAAVSEFRQNLELWRRRGVIAFRIYVASEVRSTAIVDALHGHQEEFGDLGVAMDLCDGRQISRLLTSQRSIVSKYLDPHWTEIICGPLQPLSPSAFDPRGRGLEIQLDLSARALSELSDSLSRHVASRIEEIRERYRRGHRRASKSELQEVLDDSDWPRLAPAVRSRALRLMALYALNLDGDTAVARELAQRADIHSEDELSQLLEAIIRLKDDHEIPAAAANAPPEVVRLRSAALIESGKATEAVETLTSQLRSGSPDAESSRLLALAYLALGKLAQARGAVDEALASHPNWLSVREASAMVLFWEGAGVAAGVPINHYLPGPFPAELVRADETAARKISSAAEQFSMLAEEADDLGERWRLLLWRFVCLVNSPHQDVAREALQALLHEDPASPIVLSWALTRRLPIDTDNALQALEGATPAQPDYLDRIGIRAGLLLEAGRAESALNLLHESSDAFGQAGQTEALAYWRVQALAALDRHAEARTILDGLANADVRERLRLQVERHRATSTGEIGPLLQALENAYRRTGGMDVLLELVEGKLTAGDPGSAEALGAELATGAPTPSTVRLLARAHWEAKRPRACLDLLSSSTSVFPGQQLPEDLRRLRVHCQRVLGYLIEAIEEARTIAQVENTPQAWIDLLEVQTDHGDIAGVAATAPQILAAVEISQADLLRAAGVVAIGNPALARQLWERAITAGTLEDALVFVAFSLGNQLAVSEPELEPIARRIAELGESGSPLVQSLELRDAIQIMRESQERAEEIYLKYTKGEVPLHILPENYRPTVIETFSITHPKRSGCLDPFVEMPMLARYGGWPIRDATPLHGVLLLDVSSLALTIELGLLRALIDAFDAVMIPRATQRLLLSEISRAKPHQPRRAAALQRVLERTRSGGIGIEPEPIAWSRGSATHLMGPAWVARMDDVRRHGAASVDLVPLLTHDGAEGSPEIPGDLLQHVTSPHSVAFALAEAGVLPQDDLQERLARLGPGSDAGNGMPAPERGQRLYISSAAAEVLSAADLLNSCCDFFSVRMYEDELARIAEEVEADRLRSSLAAWGQGLVEEITDWLTTGGLSLISPSDGGDPESPRDSLATECLLDLLRADVPGGLVCCDDRYINRHALMGQRPTTSVPDLLAALRRTGRIRDRTYFEALHRLRRANYCFLPLAGEEIICRLRGTRIQRGRLKESEQLATLRTWWAGCCLPRAALQKPGEQQDGSSEAALLLNTRRAITDAMHGVWADRRTGAQTRAARAQWLLNSLFVGLLESQRHMPASGQSGDSRVPALAGADVALLLSASLSLSWTHPGRGSDRPIAEEYLHWLVEAYIGSILAVDRHLAEPAASSLRDLALGMLKDTSGAHEREALMLILGRFIDNLPEALKAALSQDSEMAGLFGLQSAKWVSVAGYSFGFDDFWEACSTAVDGQRSRIRPVSGGYYLYLRRDEASSGSPRLELVRADASIAGRMTDPMFGVISGRHAEIVAALERSRHWTDGDERSTEELAQEIGRLGPVQRIERVQSIAGRSAADHYHRLEQDFGAEHRLSMDQISPWELHPIASYFRVGAVDSADFAQAWTTAATSMVEELGVEGALGRVLCVPSRIPEPVISHIDSMDDEQARSLLQDKFDGSSCPITLLNLLSVLARSRRDVSWREPLATEVVRKLSGEAFRPDFELTKAIASRLSTRSAAVDDNAELEPAVRLAVIWGHAATVVDIIRKSSLPSARVTAWIGETALEVGGLFRLTRADRADFWGTRRVSAPHLLFDGLATALLGNDFREIRSDLDQLVDLLRRFPSPAEPWILPVLGDPQLRTDILGSGMTSSRDHLVELLPDVGSNLSGDNLYDQARAAVAALEADPTASAPWLQLAAIVGDLPIYADLRERLQEAIDQVPLVALRRDDWTPLALALPILATTSCIDGSQTAVSTFVDRLIELLRELERDDSQEKLRIYEQIVEAVYSAAMNIEDETDRRRTFFASLARVLSNSCGLCDAIAPAVLNLRRTLPSDYRGEIADLLFVSRARTGSDAFG